MTVREYKYQCTRCGKLFNEEEIIIVNAENDNYYYLCKKCQKNA